jgi:hypothetical protein
MPSATRTILKVSSAHQLDLHHVDARIVTYRGQRAIRLQESDHNLDDVQPLAILPGIDFADGSIHTTLTGLPRLGAPEDARGFVGIAFHVQPDASQFETFFLRPTNSRSQDQLRRNHSTQYMSHPHYPWFRLREEAPGAYESYVDLDPGSWTPIKIVVSGASAALYVSRAAQPCLFVNDLKLGKAAGKVALWIGGGTLAYFSTSIVINRAA